MLYIFFGPSCSGKSTAARLVAKENGADIWTGKDYLRLAKHEPDALKAFVELLQQANEPTSEKTAPIIYVMTDPPESVPEIAALTPQVRISFTASLETLTTRFAPRTGGTTPPPVVKMLGKAKEKMDCCQADYSFDSDEESVEAIVGVILGIGV